MHLRKADIDDALSVLEWRNDETTRMNSFGHDVISKETHISWFKKKLSDKSCHFFILEDDKGPAGCVRVDVTNDIGEVSQMIAPDRRGMGYGTISMSLMEEELKKTDVKTLVGLVTGVNAASAKCCIKNGYTRLTAGDVDVFVKNI